MPALQGPLTAISLAFVMSIGMLFLSSVIYLFLTYRMHAVSYLMKVAILGLISMPMGVILLLAIFFWIFAYPVRVLQTKKNIASGSVTEKEEADVVVHLVHGTFERDASWTHPDSPMCREIANRNPGIQLSRFIWSGSNTQQGRAEAVIKLAERIKASPSSQHYIVAHSHGGSIVRDLSHKHMELAKKIQGVCLLSTPFIYRKKIRRTGRTFAYMHVIGLMLLPQLLAFAALARFGFYNKLTFFLGLAVGAIAVFCELKVSKWVEAKLDDELANEQEAVALKDVQIFHSIGDEADSALRFASFLHEMCFGLFSELDAANKMMAKKRHLPYLGAVLFMVTSFVLAFLFHSPRILTWALSVGSIALLGGYIKEKFKPSREELNALILASVPVGILSYILCAIKAIAYGDWRLIFSPGLFIFSSETPKGDFSVLKYAPSADGSLIHSTHSHPQAIVDVAEWIASRLIEE
jgi:hypothetical protein